MNLISLLYNNPFRFYHQMKHVMFAETRSFPRQNRLFLMPKKNRSLYIKICPAANTNRMTAFWYPFESSAQCASNESNFIALGRSVQVLPLDEDGHVYRNRAISASNFNFPNYFNFRSLNIRNCPSAKTDRRIARFATF